MTVSMRDIKAVAWDVNGIRVNCIFNIEIKLNGELLWVEFLMV